MSLQSINDEYSLVENAKLMGQDDLYSLIENLEYAYRMGKQSVSDDTFDELKEIYENRFIEIPEMYPPLEGDKIKLPFRLLSLDKIKINEFEHKTGKGKKKMNNYKSKFPGPYILEDKIDGLTGLLYKNKMYTKGNSEYGVDISFIIPLLNLPQNEISMKYPIRGEIVMEKHVFDEYKKIKPDASDPRSTVAGFINSKHNVNIEFIKKLKYYAYEIIQSQLIPEHQLTYLQNWGFEIPWIYKYDDIDIDLCLFILQWRKQKSKYMMDGLVITQNKYVIPPKNRKYPYHIIAFKRDGSGIKTKVIDVKYLETKDRILFPTVYYETVFTDVNMNASSGKSAKFVFDNGIGIGAEILITRGGDVTPDIIGIVKSVSPALPDFDPSEYEWDETKTNLVLKFDTNRIKAKRIEHFTNVLNIRDIGYERIIQLVDAGYDTIDKFINLTKENFLMFEGYEEVLANKISQNIQNAITNVPLYKIMAASNIFGRNIGPKRTEAICTIYPNILEMSKLNINELITKISEIDGFGENISSQFASRLSMFVNWLNQNPKIILYDENINQTQGIFDKMGLTDTNVPQTLKNKIVLVSEFRGDAEFENKIRQRGGKYDPTGKPTLKNRDNTILVYIPSKRTTGKLRDAEKLGIFPILKDEFEKKYFI